MCTSERPAWRQSSAAASRAPRRARRQTAAGAQHIGRRIEQAAEDIKAVGTALERQIGLEVLDLVR